MNSLGVVVAVSGRKSLKRTSSSALSVLVATLLATSPAVAADPQVAPSDALMPPVAAQTRPDQPALERKLKTLLRERPGVVAPIVISSLSGMLFMLGILEIIQSVTTFASPNGDPNVGNLALGISSSVVGIGGFIGSLIWGRSRIETRSELDHEAAQVEFQLGR